jgi:hypothetical protein
MEKNEKPMPTQKSSLGERMGDTSTMMIKKDGKWVWLDTGEEVKSSPSEREASKPDDKKEKYGEFYRPSDK